MTEPRIITDVAVLEVMEIEQAGRAKELVMASQGANMDTENNRAVLVQQMKQSTEIIALLEGERKGRQSGVLDGISRMNAVYKALTDPVKEVKERLGKIFLAWQDEQTRLAREAAAALNRVQEERTMAEAKRLEEAGQSEQAAEVLQQAVDAPQYEPLPVAPARGVHGATGFARGPWKFRITNESEIPREYMMPNDKLIGAIVRAKKKLTDIPGIDAYQDRKAAVR